MGFFLGFTRKTNNAKRPYVLPSDGGRNGDEEGGRKGSVFVVTVSRMSVMCMNEYVSESLSLQ